MQSIKIIFFGSTNDSVLVLDKLFTVHHTPFTLQVSAVVTQPARPVGRKQIVTPTPVEAWAKEHTIAVLSFPSHPEKPWIFKDEQQVIDTLQPFKADLLISACYGQKIPVSTIKEARCGGSNVHPSLLPRWRGADPVPWAILAGDHQTGVTVVTLEERFDEGKIIAQQKCSIIAGDTSDELRTRLFEMGASLLIASLPDFLSGKNKGKPQQSNHTPSYARRFTRDDGFIPWELLQSAMGESPAPLINSPTTTLSLTPPFTKRKRPHEVGESNIPHNKETAIEEIAREQPNVPAGMLIDRAFRALHPWPGIWTKATINGEEKRLKILSCHLSSNSVTMQQFNSYLIIDTVQLEGKSPVPFSQFQKAYLQ